MVQPKAFGADGPTLATMMNMNMWLGMSAFDQKRHDMCEILERIAPNVGELHLFRDDAVEVHMGRECLFILPVVSISCYIIWRKCFASPFVYLPSLPVTNSLFAPGPLDSGVGRVPAGFRVVIGDPVEVIVVRFTLIPILGFR